MGSVSDTSMEVLQGGKAWLKCPGPRGMTLGEAPIYRASDSTLHWVDCLSEPPEMHILKVDPETGDALGTDGGNYRIVPLEDSVTVAFFRRSTPGSYICAYFQGVAFLDETTGKLEVLKEIIPTADRGIRRFNDGGVDARGRFWLAEIDRKAMAYGPRNLPADYGEPIGRLWRYDPDGSLHLMEKGIICGNGLAWSPDNKTSKLANLDARNKIDLVLRQVCSVLQRLGSSPRLRVRLRRRDRQYLQ